MCDRFLDEIIDNNKTIHFIGIGGVSMSGIASILLDKGFKISGSDIAENKLIKNLKDKGCKINIGHSAKNIDDNVGVVVHTAAVSLDNDEIKEAINRKIYTINRAEFLGKLTKKYNKCITISGTHGKTSTTSIFSYVSLYSDLDPTILLGGELDIIGGNFRIGKSDYMIIEACEYKESFLNFNTNIGVILNIDIDHMDYYKNLDHIKLAFKKYIEKIPSCGHLIYCDSDKNIQSLLEYANCNMVSYGINSGDVMAQNVVYNENYTSFDIYYKDICYKNFIINVIGEHNLLNCLAAIAFSFICNLDINKTKKALKDFSLPKRRFDIKGKKNGITIIEDYAHHPTEIKALIDMAKITTKGDIYCFFQPHTYSRTLSLFDGFCSCFDGVKEIILFDIYAAREKDPGNITSMDLGNKLREKNQMCYNAIDFNDALEYMEGKGKEGDVFLVVGAGSISELSNMFILS